MVSCGAFEGEVRLVDGHVCGDTGREGQGCLQGTDLGFVLAEGMDCLGEELLLIYLGGDWVGGLEVGVGVGNRDRGI